MAVQFKLETHLTLYVIYTPTEKLDRNTKKGRVWKSSSNNASKSLNL